MMARATHRVMEIAVRGEGELVLRFIDATGRTLYEERLTVSGSPKVEARRMVELSIGTIEGRAALAPVLIRQSNPKQRVTFDGESPSRFSRRRCKEIGTDASVARKAANGDAPAPFPGPGSAAAKNSQRIDKLLQSIQRGARK